MLVLDFSYVSNFFYLTLFQSLCLSNMAHSFLSLKKKEGRTLWCSSSCMAALRCGRRNGTDGTGQTDRDGQAGMAYGVLSASCRACARARSLYGRDINPSLSLSSSSHVMYQRAHDARKAVEDDNGKKARQTAAASSAHGVEQGRGENHIPTIIYICP